MFWIGLSTVNKLITSLVHLFPHIEAVIYGIRIQILPTFLSGPVHTPRRRNDNVVLILRLGLPSTLIRHENGAFRKRSSNRRNLKTLALRFSVSGRKIFWKHYDIKQKSKLTGDCYVDDVRMSPCSGVCIRNTRDAFFNHFFFRTFFVYLQTIW